MATTVRQAKLQNYGDHQSQEECLAAGHRQVLVLQLPLTVATLRLLLRPQSIAVSIQKTMSLAAHRNIPTVLVAQYVRSRYS